MPISSNKQSLTRYGLLVFLILTLFVCVIFFYIKISKGPQLASDIKSLAAINEDYSQIDSCIYVLYNADNNSRLYAVTGDKYYFNLFLKDINFVSATLNEIKLNSVQNSENNSKSLGDLVVQKKAQTKLYIKLRNLTDSLISISNAIDTAQKNIKPNLGKQITYRQSKSMTTIDTVNVVKTIAEKSFFRKVGDLFKRKDKKTLNDTTRKILKTEIKLDTSLQRKDINAKELVNMSNYFRNLYAANNKLKKNELLILELNNKIISEIVHLLQTYKFKEIDFAKQHKTTLKDNIDKTFNSINSIYLLIIVLLILLMFAILYNIWEIYRNENFLLENNKKTSQYALAKSRFLANMSHEIRTPLNSIVGFSEQLSQGNLSLAQGEQVNAIRTSSLMLLDVVNDILDFSKYETGKVNFEKVPFVPYQAINDVLNGISILAVSKNIQLKNEILFKKDVCFKGDPLRLKQVMMNLLSNAIKFTDKGSVTLKSSILELSKNNSLFKIEIVDTGIGIAEDNINMIFDEFAQVYYSSTEIKHKGTGLGLAICKKIVEFQGGKIGVTSEVDKGSVFSFEIPYETCEKDLVLVNKNLISKNSKILHHKRVLLADDNKMNILLAQTVLKKYNLYIDTAYDGKQAFALFEKNSYDIILTDIQMPEMGGLELTKMIRRYRDQSKSKIPILGITANVLQEDRNKYIESGIDDLVLKPFAEKELIDKIITYIN